MKKALTVASAVLFAVLFPFCMVSSSFSVKNSYFGFHSFTFIYIRYFIIIAVINFTIIVFNFISIVLNYQLEKKNEEAKRKLKLKKNTNKFDIRNLAELNDRCVKNFNLTSKILIIFLLLFLISNAFIQGMGFLNDINGVPTENDMGYLFQTPDR
jgi:hypothetical protein